MGECFLWHTGFYGVEQGSLSRDNWWPQTKRVRLVERRDEVALVEIVGNLLSGFSNSTGFAGYYWDTREAGERRWVPFGELLPDVPLAADAAISPLHGHEVKHE
jgi:hypothetical protein